MQGFVLVDKPKGITSFGVVKQIRRLSCEKKVGHGGTLDPLATGLLVVAVGKATKQLGGLLGADKEYEVLAQFGAVSDTYDEDGKIEIIDQEFFEGRKIFTREEIEKMIREKFSGEIEQIPPVFSAIRIKGKRAYDLARKGAKVEIPPRIIRVYDFKILELKWPEACFRISCSSGTYIRSLIHDLGQLAGCGAYVKELRRTKIGELDVSKANALDSIFKDNVGEILMETF